MTIAEQKQETKIELLDRELCVTEKKLAKLLVRRSEEMHHGYTSINTEAEIRETERDMAFIEKQLMAAIIDQVKPQ